MTTHPSDIIPTKFEGVPIFLSNFSDDANIDHGPFGAVLAVEVDFGGRRKVRKKSNFF